MKPRKTPPTERTQYGDAQSFRVWAWDPGYQEDPLPWKCVAAFQYLQECLDYIQYCNGRSHDVLFQSPGDDVKWYKAKEVA